MIDVEWGGSQIIFDGMYVLERLRRLVCVKRLCVSNNSTESDGCRRTRRTNARRP